MLTYQQIIRLVVLVAASLAPLPSSIWPLSIGPSSIGPSSIWANENPNSSAEFEQELITVLRSDALPAEKAIACKKLAIHGSSSAVPELARLLPDAQLSSWARIALEAIPGEAANEALRNATSALDGKLLVGTINSLGVRRDAQAVDLLTNRLHDQDVEVASASAVALGHIGGAAAAQALRRSLAGGPKKVRSAAAEGCVLCAEQFLADGKAAAAIEIYDEVRQAEVPQQRVFEATRGAILARGQPGIPLLLEQFRSPDKGLFQIALSTAREFPGDDIDQALADLLAHLGPERAAFVLQAMADRPETVVLTAVLDAAQQGPQQVRTAAIVALGRVGDGTCLSALLEIALDADMELVAVAKSTLADLTDQSVDATILELLPNASGKRYPLLIELVGLRRIAAMPILLEAIAHAEKEVRSAALIALGETATLQELPVLVSQVVNPKHAENTEVAQQALKAASIRMPEREACAQILTDAIQQASSLGTKGELLQTLGTMGGTTALATIGDAASSDDPELQEVSTRLLGEWMTADAAPVLLDLATNLPEGKYQIRALRGYLRIARQFKIPPGERTEMCRRALEAARRPDEQRMVLEVLKRYPNPENLQLATQAQQIPELKEEAQEVTKSIAKKLAVQERQR